MVDLAPDQPEPTGHADADEMCSYAIDVWLPSPDLLTDEKAMIEVMGRSAEAGHAVVLGSASYRFPNGAITAVLVLSQSHFSVHTWPEHQSANFDLLTCGRLNGELMLKELERLLEPTRVNVTRVIRDITDAPVAGGRTRH